MKQMRYRAYIKNITKDMWLESEQAGKVRHTSDEKSSLAFYDEENAESTLERLNMNHSDAYVLLRDDVEEDVADVVPDLKKVRIWTVAYRPFLLGGNVNAPVGCEVEVGSPIDLGAGYFGHELKTPKGNTVVVETTSGAIVGSSTQQVREDIAEGDPDMMKKQMEDACKMAQTVEMMTEEAFWNLYRR